jgi:ribose 5-phosphate isomerase A
MVTTRPINHNKLVERELYSGPNQDDGANSVPVDDRKRRAALAALESVEPGMKLGLGTGSTADAFVEALGTRVSDGLDVIGVPTSERTAELAASLGIRLTTLDAEPELDITIDGADELDIQLRLIKGGGGALLREKIVASASTRMIVIADDTKLVGSLGEFPLPIEVAPFGLRATELAIERLSEGLSLTGPINLRRIDGGEPFVTDGGHHILDAAYGEVAEPELLAAGLDEIAGVMGHGLFLGIATEAIVAGTAEISRLTATRSS